MSGVSNPDGDRVASSSKIQQAKDIFMEDRRKENKPRGNVPWDEPYERRDGNRLGKIRDWRATLSVMDVDGNWCCVKSNHEKLVNNIDWLISELQQTRASRKKILKSLGCV
jgi:nitrate/nitrite-specific signal transduction histidine kinase